MAINFTQDQLKVIEMRDRNVLVSAAAGSGKTAVLVERIVQMVCNEAHPVDIDRLLIVTFTNAAAAEMRERIAAGIARMLEEHPESEHIQRQSALLHNAQITTIDSFCLFLIRNHFNEIGLDPAFRVADEGEIKLLEQEVMQELLEDAFAGGEEAFQRTVEYFCPGGKEQTLEKYILDLYKYAESFPWPDSWLAARKQDYAADSVEELLVTDYGRFLDAHVRRMIKGASAKLAEALKLAQQPDGPYMYGELLETEYHALAGIMEGKDIIELGQSIESLSYGRLPGKKDETVSAYKREAAKQLRNEAKDILQGLQETFYSTPLELAIVRGRECREPVECLIDLVQEFGSRMRMKKQEKKLLSFSDMEHYALEILLERSEPDEQGHVEVTLGKVALEYRQYFEEILIDEYQDSNYVQELLLSTVSGEAMGKFNRFMVGDVKQSIYKFRLAEPEIFMEKYHAYEGQGEQCCRIDLSKNFRSRGEVIRTVNAIFSRIMSTEVGGIAYDDAASLYEGAVYPESEGCESELLLVEKPGREDELSSKQAEALAIANRIKQLKQNFRVTDKATGTLRSVRYSDMVILLRTNTGWDEEFKKVLEEQGIPVYISSKTGYFSANEVQEVLQLLRVIDNPRQDIALFGTLKSLFGGFTEEEIATIRAGKRKCTLYEALQEYGADHIKEVSPAEGAEIEKASQGLATQKNIKLQEKVQCFLTKLAGYRECVIYMPIRELIEKLLQEHDYIHYVTALPGGSKRRANVEMLLTKASDFEKTSYFGLFHFVRYIEQLEKYDVDFGEADTLDENADVVRIMSIHKSKGLEFPVTFVAGLAKRFNMQDTNQPMIVDMKLGLACDYVDARRRIRGKTLRQTVIAGKMREDNLAEELRVLYVALTRAREKLIMTACISNAADKYELYRTSGAKELGYQEFYQAGTYMDMLLPIVEETDIQVHMVDTAGMQEAQVSEQGELLNRREQLKMATHYSDPAKLQELQARLRYVYPHQALSGLYTKTTVSELKIAAMAGQDEAAYHAFEEKEVEAYIPRFKQDGEQVSGTVRGNAYHRVMEILDFEAVLGSCMSFVAEYEQYRSEFDAMTVKERLVAFLDAKQKELRLTQQYLQAVKPEKIVKLLQSEPAYRMWAAQRRGELYREQPFVYGVDATALGENMPAGEKVLIQGIIDVFFIEEGEIVLLDYKTDVIPDMEQLWKRYKTQMDYYEAALQGVMGKPVKEKILYSFYLECHGE